jgi:cupin 2 domain-containing protein
VLRYDKVTHPKVFLMLDKISFYNDIPNDSKQEIFFEILKKKNIRIEKIVSNGQKSPKDFWYCQEEHEFVMVLKGSAILEFEDQTLNLNEGDAVNIPAFKKHKVQQTNKEQPTIWLAVFYQ